MNRKPVTEPIRVLVVDDEPGFLKITSRILTNQGCEVIAAGSAEEAVEHLETKFFDVVLSDVRMPGMNGIELLRKLADERPTQQVVMISGHASTEMAVQVMKLGAFDFLIKPFEADDLVRTVQQAAERTGLQRRNLVLQEELARIKGLGNIVGESEAIKEILSFISRAATSDMPVLITGESGTGKELVAQAIHAASARSSHPMVVVDGSTLRTELLASELFGHEKGAFTGAARKKPGLFEIADRGSIFLDEIGELSVDNQAALLRVLETGTFRPVGSIREVCTDVRIIAATNQDVRKAAASGELREDLYFRLKGLAIHVPALRTRADDIQPVAEHFLARHNVKANTGIRISNIALIALESYSWPGNVRELKHVIELAALLASEEGSDIETRHLPEEIRGNEIVEGDEAAASGWTIHVPQGNPTLADFRDYCEQRYISRLLREFKGNKTQVRRALDISSSVLYPKLRRLGFVDKNSHAPQDD
jgi:DNA-binding NtrC family response regulator